MRILRLLLGLLISGLFISCATPNQATDRQINWRSLGMVRLGATESQVLTLMGEPSTKVPSSDGGVIWKWEHRENMLAKSSAWVGFKNGRVVGVPPFVMGNSQSSSQFFEGQHETKMRELREDRANELKRDFPRMSAEFWEAVASGRVEVWEARQQLRKQDRIAYVSAHPELTPQVRQLVLNGRIQIGMSAEETRASLGKPERINTTVNQFGAHEQWVYGSSYVYFDKGVLSSWQQSK